MTTSNALTGFTVKTMSTLDLLNLINDVRREEGKVTLAHRTLTARVEKHPGIQCAKFLAHYTDSEGRSQKCYKLPKRESELMVMSESLAVQAKVYDRLVAALDEAKPVEAPQLANPIMNMIVQQAIQYDKLEQQQKELANQLQTATSLISATSNRVEQVAAIVGAQDPQYYSVKAYANVIGTRVNDATAVKLGRLASKMSADSGIELGSVKDAVWGRVNSYHQSVLEEAFATLETV